MSRTAIPLLSLSSSAITKGIKDSNRLNYTVWVLLPLLHEPFCMMNIEDKTLLLLLRSWNNLQFHLHPDLKLVFNAWRQQNCRSWFIRLEDYIFFWQKYRSVITSTLYSWNHKPAKFWWISLIFYTTLWGLILFFLQI